MTAEQVVDMGMEDYSMRQYRLEQIVANYLDWRHKDIKDGGCGRATSTCAKEAGAISGFLRRNRVIIEVDKKWVLEPVFERTKRLLSQEEVTKMIATTDVLEEQAVICVEAQTAQRIGILPALQYSMIRRYPDPDGKVYGIVEVPPEIRNQEPDLVNKIRTHYTFCLHWESMKLLDRMRDKSADKEHWIWEKRLTKRRMQEIIEKAAKRAGLQKKIPTGIEGLNKYEIHPHVFRRYLKHQMRKGGVTDSDLLRYLLGQTPQAHGTYDIFPDEDILEAYHKADQYLRVLPPDSHPLVPDA